MNQFQDRCQEQVPPFFPVIETTSMNKYLQTFTQAQRMLFVMLFF